MDTFKKIFKCFILFLFALVGLTNGCTISGGILFFLAIFSLPIKQIQEPVIKFLEGQYNEAEKEKQEKLTPEEYMKSLKKVYTILCVVFSIFIFVRCGDNPNPNIQELEVVEQTVNETQDPEYNINIASDVAYRTFTAEDGVLNKGYKLKGKLYQTRSKDFSKVYIFGALVEHNGQIYKCLWANNEVDATGMYESINQNAVNVSGIMSSNKVTMNDDGVAKIEQKLSEDLNNLNKPVDIKINPNIACDYLKTQGLVTNGYKSDGMGGYFCATPYKVLDGKSNVAYYVEGTQSSADKLYLSLNVYNGSNASTLQEQLANYAKTLSKQALNYDLNAENVKAIKSGANSNIDVAGNYKIEIIKNSWDTQKGFDIQFVIKKK